ncbi:MAG TPA: GNAT family N-acetyltransferase [Candidatus Acidoferrum sp.]|nr:GNAT family N-acetyltransferase [Candidatus Acidoferrum sp.]
MIVRRTTMEDRPQLVELMQGYFAFYRKPLPTDDKLLEFLDALEVDPDQGVQLVAEADGRLMGFASLYTIFDTLLADRILVMNDLFVRPDARSGGIGAALFSASRTYAREHGFPRLDWVTAPDNVEAQRFYERHGGRRGAWIPYSVTP